jgi:transposase
MLSLPLPVRVYLCLEPTDMRRSFDGLCRMVREHLGADPLSGDLFVFRSRRGDRVKLLYWLGDGLAIWYRRLEEGTFVFPKSADACGTSGLSWWRAAGEQGLEIRANDLAMLLDGVDLKSVKRQKRYQRPTATQTTPTTMPVSNSL